MNAAKIRADLDLKLRSLNEEIAAWRALVQAPSPAAKNPDFAIFSRHQSQILRLTELFSGIAATLEQNAEALGQTIDFETAAAFSKKILQAHALWSYYRGKLLFRHSAHLRRYLLAADEYAWFIFRPLLEARTEAVRAQPGAPPLAKEPPLIYLDGALIPLVFPREWTLKKQIPDVPEEVFGSLVLMAPFPVVRLPYFQTTHLPGTLLLAHEMGHVVDLDLRLEKAIDAAFDAISEIPADHKANWKRCRTEAFADVFGAAANRLAFCRTLAAFLATDRTTVVNEEFSDGKKYIYPTIYLRVLLCLEVLRHNGALPAGAEALLQEWRQTYGEDHLYRAYEKDLPFVVKALLDTPLAELNGKTVRDLAGLPVSADTAIAELAGEMLLQQLKPDSDDPRVLLAAATLAFDQDPAGYKSQGIGAMILTCLEEIAGNAPRGPEKLTPDSLQADRQAGAELAQLLG